MASRRASRWGPAPRPVRDRAAGFLMLEVIVALVIAALAFGFAFPAISESLGRLRQDRDSAGALAVAHSTLDRVGHEIPLEPGTPSGRAGRYDWQVAIAAYKALQPPAEQGVAGYEVAVAVRWTDAGRDRELRLRTIRLGPALDSQ